MLVLLACAVFSGSSVGAGCEPLSEERCDTAGIDEDCDGLVLGPTVSFHDVDGDSYGGASFLACEPPEGSVGRGGDCDDADPTRHPGLPELCDGGDDDCDMTTSEVGASLFTADGVSTAWDGGVLDTPGVLTLCPGEFPPIVITADVDVVGTGAEVVGGITVEGEGTSPTLTGLSVTGGEPGLVCTGDVALTLDEVWLRDNPGGGLTVDGCAVFFAGGGVTGNSAADGAGIRLLDGRVELSQALVSGNHAVGTGGGIAMLPTGEGYAELVLGDTVVEANTAGTAAALALDGNSLVHCYGINPGQWGFLGNTSESGGVLVTTGDALFESMLCDFGEPGTSEDNLPIDLSTSGGSWAWGDDVQGWCWEEGGCVTL